MLAILDTAVVSGLRGELVRVEVDVAPGLPGCQIVGLPDAALSEARERVRSAIRNAGFAYPLSRITVNLAPADRRKHGAAYDVAIAIGILLASEQLRASGGAWALLGELSLDGGVMPVPGVLPMVATLREAGHRRVCVPVANRRGGRPRRQASRSSASRAWTTWPGWWRVHAVASAAAARRRVAHPRRRGADRRPADAAPSGEQPRRTCDERERHGPGRRARPAARPLGARGRPRGSPQPPAHRLTRCRQDPAGARHPGLLPPLTDAEAREVAVIRSVAGQEVPARGPRWRVPSWRPITPPPTRRWWAVAHTCGPAS